MLIFGIAGITLGILGLAFALRFYWELYRWAKLLQGGRVAIARKGKVRMQAPITEIALWIRQLSKDEESSGRVIYRDNNTTVAILRPPRDQAVQMRLAKLLLPIYTRSQALRARLPRRKAQAAA